MAAMTKKAWKEMFRTVGITEDDMNRWHSVFEKNYPEAHQSFLEWLNLDEASIREIRQNSA